MAITKSPKSSTSTRHPSGKTQPNGSGGSGDSLTGKPISPVVKFGSVTTSATGSTFVQLTAEKCNKVLLLQFTGTTLEVKLDNAGTALPLPSGIGKEFEVANASHLWIRRLDVSNTQVTMGYETTRY